MTRIYGNLNNYTEGPSALQLERIELYGQELNRLVEELDQLIANEIANLNIAVEQNGIRRITIRS